MDTRPIGIFDSGLGGLTAVRALVQAAPWESFVYLGDTAHAPYGDRTREELRDLSRANVRFLRSKDVKAVLVACNTSTANAMDSMRAENLDIPLVGVIEPAAAAAVSVTETGRIGVLATAATVASGAYDRAIRQLSPEAVVTAQACPKLVPLVEAGRTDPADPDLRAAAAEYTAPLRAAGVDAVILGCTHYPIIRRAIRASLGPDTALIDSGAASVGRLLKALENAGAMGDKNGTGRRQFFSTGPADRFAALGAAFLGWSLDGLTEQTDL